MDIEGFRTRMLKWARGHLKEHPKAADAYRILEEIAQELQVDIETFAAEAIDEVLRGYSKKDSDTDAPLESTADEQPAASSGGADSKAPDVAVALQSEAGEQPAASSGGVVPGTQRSGGPPTKTDGKS